MRPPFADCSLDSLFEDEQKTFKGAQYESVKCDADAQYDEMNF